MKEIKALQRDGGTTLLSALEVQKQMLLDKRRQLDEVIGAIERLEAVGGDKLDYHALVHVIEVMQMDLKPEWVSKYLTEGERRTLRVLAKQSFSREALRKLGQREYTEEIHEQYEHFRMELKRLVAERADPGSDEALNLAQLLLDLNESRSGGDPDVLLGMRKTWEGFNALPADKKPAAYVLTTEEREFVKQACAILCDRRKEEKRK